MELVSLTLGGVQVQAALDRARGLLVLFEADVQGAGGTYQPRERVQLAATVAPVPVRATPASGAGRPRRCAGVLPRRLLLHRGAPIRLPAEREHPIRSRQPARSTVAPVQVTSSKPVALVRSNAPAPSRLRRQAPTLSAAVSRVLAPALLATHLARLLSETLASKLLQGRQRALFLQAGRSIRVSARCRRRPSFSSRSLRLCLLGCRPGAVAQATEGGLPLIALPTSLARGSAIYRLHQASTAAPCLGLAAGCAKPNPV